jgi:NAD(P)-dependent dehydrogenase (short-subunit alcohol dehydrogenase family)
VSGEPGFDLQGRTALVIGGTSGIGREIALGFQAAGARVFVASSSAEKVERAQRELQQRDGSARGFVADVREAADLQRLADEVEAVATVDVLLNAQGTTVIKPALEFSAAEYAKVMRTNLDGVFWACVAFGRRMVARKRGTIINIGSLASFRGWPNSSVYAMTKSAVVSLTESLAAEWAASGVRVNAIAPGFFMTDMTRDRMSAERKARALARTPMGRFGELHELVGAAVYLASASAGFVTGATIAVDGGYLATGI